jgi:hypothetical protein
VLKKGLASLSPYLRMMLLSVMKPLPCKTQAVGKQSKLVAGLATLRLFATLFRKVHPTHAAAVLLTHPAASLVLCSRRSQNGCCRQRNIMPSRVSHPVQPKGVLACALNHVQPARRRELMQCVHGANVQLACPRLAIGRLPPDAHGVRFVEDVNKDAVLQQHVHAKLVELAKCPQGPCHQQGIEDLAAFCT